MSEESVLTLTVAYRRVDTLLFIGRSSSDQGVDRYAFNIKTDVGSVTGVDNTIPITIDVSYKEVEADRIVCRVVVRHEFDVAGLEHFKKGDKYVVPLDLFLELVANAYSTTRGITLARMAGTPGQSLVLPMIDAADYVDTTREIEGSNIIIDLSESADH